MQTAYMKAHYYLEYMTPLISSYIGKSDAKDKVISYIEEVKSMGYKILPPDVNMSEFEHNIEDGNFRFALAAISGMFKSAYSIIEERNLNGKFIDLYDLFARVPLNKLAVDSLVYSGALDTLALETNFNLIHEDIVYMKTKKKVNITDFTRQEIVKYEAKISKVGEGDLEEISREKISFNILEVTCNRDTLLQYIYYIKGFGQAAPNPDILEMIDNRAKLKEDNLSRYMRLMTEKLYLDMYLSGHPLDGIAQSTKWDSDGQKEIIAIIRDTRKIITGKGDPMAFVQIESLEGVKELLLFPRQYENLIGKCEKNGIRKLTLESKWSPDRGYSHIINSIRYYKDGA